MKASIYKSESGRQQLMARYQEVLQQWPLDNKQYHVPTRHGSTFVIETGAAHLPPLLLLHGSMSNSFAWLGDVEELSREYRVFAVDLIGEAGLSAPSRPPYAGGAYADWLTDVAQALGLNQFALTGLSLGGWMALDFATRHPHRVQQLILLCPGGVVRENVSFLVKALFYMLCGRWGQDRVARLLNGGMLPQDEGMRQALDFVNLIAAHFKPRTARLTLFEDTALAALSMPVMIICGAKDALIPPHASIERLQRCVPHSQTLLLPDHGHVIANQAPAMLAFLRAPCATATTA